MAWTAPMTAVATNPLSAATFNTHVRDNLAETEAAKALTAGNYFVSTAANAIAARASAVASIHTLETLSSTSYADTPSAGPSVTVTTGTKALVIFSCGMATQTTNASTTVSVEVSGASTVAASDTWAIIADGVTAWSNPSEPFDQHNRRCSVKLFTGLTPGSNTFKMKYKVSSSTGRFADREIIVYPL